MRIVSQLKRRFMNYKKPLISLLERQREKCKKALTYFMELEEKTSVSDKWKYSRENPFYNDLEGLIAKQTLPPVKILRITIQTLDEYIITISNFSDNEFRAFLLGLGLNWMPS